MTAWTHSRSLLAALTAALALAACAGADDPLAPPDERHGDTAVWSVDAPGSISQTVRVTPAEPSRGDTLRIVSVVRNEGGAPVDVVTRICGMDLEGGLRFEPMIRCAGYSMSAPLAPGDSIVGTDGGVVASHAGTYALRLRHLLQPERWVDLSLTVRE